MPILEYEKEEDPERNIMGQSVIIEVESFQRDLGNVNLFERQAVYDAADEDEDCDGNDDGGIYTLVSEGMLTRQDGLLQLLYEEVIDEEGEEMEPTKVCITFPKDGNGPVSVSRSGAMHTIFTVEQNVRQFSAYDTPYGRVDLCVIGKKIENGIGQTGGVLRLDYVVELRGATTQRTKMIIRVRPNSAKK